MAVPEEVATLKIRANALRRAMAYAEALDPFEFGAFLLGQRGSQVVDALLLAPRQHVTLTSLEISGLGVLQASREAERMDRDIKGWAHGHGRLPAFHSQEDHENTRQLLDQIGPWNQVNVEEVLLPCKAPGEPEGLRFDGGYEMLEILSCDPPSSGELRLRRTIPIGLCYSLVVSSRSDPYAELHTWQPCAAGQGHVERRVIPIEVLPEEPHEPLDPAALLAEIRERVQIVLPPLRPHPSVNGRREPLRVDEGTSPPMEAPAPAERPGKGLDGRARLHTSVHRPAGPVVMAGLIGLGMGIALGRRRR